MIGFLVSFCSASVSSLWQWECSFRVYLALFLDLFWAPQRCLGVPATGPPKRWGAGEWIVLHFQLSWHHNVLSAVVVYWWTIWITIIRKILSTNDNFIKLLLLVKMWGRFDNGYPALLSCLSILNILCICNKTVASIGEWNARKTTK